jgi:hypothetical protein
MDMGRVMVAADMAPTQSPFVVFTGITFFNRFRLDKMRERCLQTLNCFTIRGWGWSIVHMKKMILLEPFNGCHGQTWFQQSVEPVHELICFFGQFIFATVAPGKIVDEQVEEGIIEWSV